MIAEYAAQLESMPNFSNGLWACRFPGDQRGNELWFNLVCINLPVCNPWSECLFISVVGKVDAFHVSKADSQLEPDSPWRVQFFLSCRLPL